jgi:hypothetical protein
MPGGDACADIYRNAYTYDDAHHCRYNHADIYRNAYAHGSAYRNTNDNAHAGANIYADAHTNIYAYAHADATTRQTFWRVRLGAQRPMAFHIYQVGW